MIFHFNLLLYLQNLYKQASKVAKAIGQAFNIAYRQFLQSNGISHEHVEEAEYCHVLESQKLVGEDLDKLTDNTASRDVSAQFSFNSLVKTSVTHRPLYDSTLQITFINGCKLT